MFYSKYWYAGTVEIDYQHWTGKLLCMVRTSHVSGVVYTKTYANM